MFPRPALPSADLPAPTSAAERRKRRLTAAPEGEDINPYSFRHTLGRMLRARRPVSRDEISLMLSHIPVDENDTTAIYSPHDPLYCANAKQAIEDICRQIDARMVKRRLVLDREDVVASASSLARGSALAVVPPPRKRTATTPRP